jgi:hypothetical protein
MTRLTSFVLVLGSLALFALPGCGGGSGAALSYHVFPGDQVVTGRRLEQLARQFEDNYGCVETDTITIVGFAAQTYNVDGCGHITDYVLQCGYSSGYSGYGGGQRCTWEELANLAAQAATDFRCDAAAIDEQVTQGLARTVSGCGYQATYQYDRGQWMLLGRIEQVGPVTESTGGVSVSGSAYVQ